MPEEKTLPSTQEFLPIKEIKDGVIVLKNGTLRTIIMARGSEFELKSEAEQNGIIYSYQGFINSLTFPIQIVIRSKKLDLNTYLDKLQKKEEEQDNELLRSQTADYIEFIKYLLEVSSIMSKEFYVIVPFNPGGIQSIKKSNPLFGGSKEQNDEEIDKDFENNKVALLERTDLVVEGLQEVGLRVAQLNTEELIELFYSIYNPEEAQNQPIKNLEDLTTPILTTEKKEGEETQKPASPPASDRPSRDGSQGGPASPSQGGEAETPIAPVTPEKTAPGINQPTESPSPKETPQESQELPKETILPNNNPPDAQNNEPEGEFMNK